LKKYLAEPGSALQENIKVGSRTYRCVRSDHISIYAVSVRVMPRPWRCAFVVNAASGG
jgi:hypothetical protein